MAVSAYSQARRREQMTNAQEQLADGVRAQIGAAPIVTREIVDATVRDMIAELRSNARTVGTEPATENAAGGNPTIDEPATDGSRANDKTADRREIVETHGASVDEMNAARAAQIADRRAAILQLFRSIGEMSIADLQKRLQDDRSIEASENTIRADVAELVTVGDLVKRGRGRWAAALPIAQQLPEPATVSVNRLCLTNVQR